MLVLLPQQLQHHLSVPPQLFPLLPQQLRVLVVSICLLLFGFAVVLALEGGLFEVVRLGWNGVLEDVFIPLVIGDDGVVGLEEGTLVLL